MLAKLIAATFMLTLAPTQLTDTPVTPQNRFGINPRLDWQANANNTFVFRYSFTHSDIQNSGIGGFNIVSRAYGIANNNQTVQPGKSTCRIRWIRVFRSGKQSSPGIADAVNFLRQLIVR